VADSKRERARRETRRRFEQWARNPECHSNVTSAVHNVKMGAAARRENPNAPRDAQSVFALERGNAFEASLINNGAPILLEALRGAEVISTTSTDFADQLLWNSAPYERASTPDPRDRSSTIHRFRCINGGGPKSNQE
jgi:hypothetical protein